MAKTTNNQQRTLFKTKPIKANFRQEMPKMPRRNNPAPGPAASRQGQDRRLFGSCVVRLPALSRRPVFPKVGKWEPLGKVHAQIEVASIKNAEIFEKL